MTSLRHRRNLRRRRSAPHVHWQHVIGFLIVLVPVTTWAIQEQKIHKCGQLTIVEVCK